MASRRAWAAGDSTTSRIGNGRQRLRRRLPRHVVAIRAGVAVIAVAGLPRFFQADFERRQPGKVAVGVGGDLVGRSRQLEIGPGGAVHLDAGHIGSQRAAMVAGAHQQRPAPVGRQVGNHRDVVFQRGEGGQNIRQPGPQRPFGGRGPVAHVDAVGQIEPRQPHGLVGRQGGCEGRCHGIQQRKPDSGSKAFENGAPVERFAGNDHFLAISWVGFSAVGLGSPRRCWKGTLWTIPKMRLCTL